VPGGGATAAAFELTLLRRAGFAAGEPARHWPQRPALFRSAAFAPVLAVPAIVGGASVDHGLG
jgi:hypothetical protein